MTIHHACDLCGADEPLPIKAAIGYMVHAPSVCGNCGFVFVPERRSPAEIASAWDDLWGEDYTSSWPAVRARLFYVAEWFDQKFGWAGKRVLDIGAGEGDFLAYIAARGAIPVGLDPCKRNAELIVAGGFEAYECTIEDMPADRKFDVVTILWTLENSGDCIGMLRRARELVAPSGLVVVATGSRILVPPKKPLGAYFSKLPADLHCFRFSVNTLHAALGKAGLYLVENNLFVDCDWLVTAARPDEPPVPLRPPYDNPETVLDHFDKWREVWP